MRTICGLAAALLLAGCSGAKKGPVIGVSLLNVSSPLDTSDFTEPGRHLRTSAGLGNFTRP